MLPVVQVGGAFALLIAAGLLQRSYSQVRHIEPGFDAGSIVKGRVVLSDVYSFDETRETRDRIMLRMREISGVHAALLYYDAFSPGNPENTRTFIVRNRPPTPGQPLPFVHRQKVSPNFFEVMGVDLLDGRLFDGSDQLEETYVVDELFAQRYLPSGNVLGAEIVMDNQVPNSSEGWKRVVGVTSRANLHGLEQRDGLPVIYTVMLDDQSSWEFTVLLRSDRPPADVIAEMRRAVRSVDPSIPLQGVGVLQDALDDMLFERRSVTMVLAGASVLALLLAFVSTYGVFTYQVARRTREVGIRRALGATGVSVALSFLRQSVLQAAVGILAGAVGAAVLARSLRSFLFDVTPFDLGIYVYSSGCLLLTAVLAALLPAIRAAQVSPLRAIAAE